MEGERASNQHFPESQLPEDPALFSEKIASTRASPLINSATFRHISRSDSLLRFLFPPLLSSPTFFIPRSLIFSVITTKNNRKKDRSPVCTGAFPPGNVERIAYEPAIPIVQHRSASCVSIPFYGNHLPSAICRLSRSLLRNICHG